MPVMPLPKLLPTTIKLSLMPMVLKVTLRKNTMALLLMLPRSCPMLKLLKV
jgi:hypothetical protein